MDRRDIGPVTKSSLWIPETFKVTFFEDFLTCSSTTAPAAGATRTFSHNWWWIGSSPSDTDIAAPGTTSAGAATVMGDATRAGQCYLTDGSSTVARTFSIIPTPGIAQLTPVHRSSIVKFRYAQIGTAAGTRRIGLANKSSFTGLATAPTDGIYMEHAVDSDLTLVVRTSSTSTTLASGSNAADSAMFEVTLEMFTSKVVFWLNGVLIGTVTTNVPSAVPLTFAAGTSVATNNEGLSIDYLYMEMDR